ncbi:MAG TPA: hypothetical protein VNJ05_03615, partial [Sphingomicrobium sp.]|nr:hypothetical protein [Sphingomicrobium sp.]
MGKILRFRRRKRWSRPKDYWQNPDDIVTVRGVARETVEWLGHLRPIILGATLLTIWPAMDPALVEPPGFLQTEPERV